MINSSVYIVAAKRTQIGKKNGGLKKLLAHELGAHVIKSIIWTHTHTHTNEDYVVINA